MKKIGFILLSGLILSGCTSDKKSDNVTLNTNTSTPKETVEQVDTGANAEENTGLGVEFEEIEEEFDLSDKRDAIYDAVETFIEVRLSFDSKYFDDREIRSKRREALEPYVTAELLKKYEPSDEEYIEQGITPPDPDAEFEYDETVSPITNLQTYSYDLDSRSIYINEESLSSDTVKVLGDTRYAYITDFEGSIDELDTWTTYVFTLIEEEKNQWVISEYETIHDVTIRE